ncbi:hypothetical protein [Streptomyces himalayensis]|uniref:Uncharacterized protein n=1 Tax=Streptomyces himalayensis subsp. himalayensis TaxID=2756131 RepID=A0A7W0DNS5_9ACTN|nr:hypothetical protein [Streptomyces himalayensis]MBA2948503.1 hypothetical protein [Streptomyces himalayensis subsp. himalayensis]
MTSPSQDEIESAVRSVGDLHISTVPAEHSRAAGHAAANLCSGAGLLAASTELQQMITQAIEIGYAAALRDVRDGDFDGDIQEWRPDLFFSRGDPYPWAP